MSEFRNVCDGLEPKRIEYEGWLWFMSPLSQNTRSKWKISFLEFRFHFLFRSQVYRILELIYGLKQNHHSLTLLQTDFSKKQTGNRGKCDWQTRPLYKTIMFNYSLLRNSTSYENNVYIWHTTHHFRFTLQLGETSHKILLNQIARVRLLLINSIKITTEAMRKYQALVCCCTRHYVVSACYRKTWHWDFC